MKPEMCGLLALVESTFISKHTLNFDIYLVLNCFFFNFELNYTLLWSGRENLALLPADCISRDANRLRGRSPYLTMGKSSPIGKIFPRGWDIHSFGSSLPTVILRKIFKTLDCIVKTFCTNKLIISLKMKYRNVA